MRPPSGDVLRTILAVLLALAAGCGKPDQCRTDGDCGDGLLCDSGQCSAAPPHPPGTAASLIRDGASLLLAARAGADRFAPGGAIAIARSLDGNRWSPVATVGAPGDARAPAIGISGKRVLLAFAAGGDFPGGRFAAGASDRTSVFLASSSDDGAHFAPPQFVNLAPWSFGAPHGRIVQAGNDGLLPVDAWYSADDPDPDHRGDFAVVLRSVDGGTTWSPPTLIARGHREPVLAASGAAATALIRNDAGWLALSESVDGGATWSVPLPFVADARHDADLVRLPDGRLLVVFVGSAPADSIHALLGASAAPRFGPTLFHSLVAPGPGTTLLGPATAPLDDGSFITLTDTPGGSAGVDPAAHSNFSHYRESDLALRSFAAVGAARQLLIDDLLIDRADGATLEVEPPRKTGEILVLADQPWENWIGPGFSTVLNDGGRLRLWYEALPTFGDLNTRLCYAEWQGTAFEKPALGLVAYAGSDANNIVFPTGTLTYAGGSVFIDPNGSPAERYKLVGEGTDAKGVLGVHGAVSPDGLHFTPLPAPVLDAHSDTQNVMFWDDERRRYVLYARNWHDVARGVSRFESVDYRSFATTGEQYVMLADAMDPPRHDLYNSAATKYPFARSTYLAFVSVFDYDADSLSVQLATSRDGIHWTRYREPAWLPLGGPGQFDSKAIYQAPGVVREGDDLSVYYSAFDVGHDALVSARRTGVLSRAVLRLDRFRAARADGAGTLTTVPMAIAGPQLLVNANGRIRAALLDEQGNAIPGFALDDCSGFAGDELNGPITWRGDSSSLRNRLVRVRFELTAARLYAFQFTAGD